MFIFCLTAPSGNICCILTNFAYLSSTTAVAVAVAVAVVAVVAVVAADPTIWLFPTELDGCGGVGIFLLGGGASADEFAFIKIK